MFNTISKKTRKKTRRIRYSSPTPRKHYICGYPEIVDVRENPNFLSLDESNDYQEQESLINNFLNNPNTQSGDTVNYSPPNQNGMWTAIVQMDTRGNKCLGTRRYPSEYPSDSESDSEPDDNGYKSDYSYLSDSYGGKKHKSKKHKSKKHKSKKHKSKK